MISNLYNFPITLQTNTITLGRNDFDNIDNEALDFEQLEAFIQNNSSVVQSPANGTNQSNNPNEPSNPTNLPESPPDSGSEPPYSPNVKNLQLVDQMPHMNTLTELHVPHHHSMMTTPSSELYISNEHTQFSTLMQHASGKHENQILHHQPTTAATSSAPQDHMMLYQVNQSGQIIELNHIHHPNQQQLNGRMLELEASASQIHELQQHSNIADNLQIMGENFTQISNHPSSLNSSDNVKKRRAAVAGNFSGAIDGEVKVKGYGKTSESSEFFLLYISHINMRYGVMIY